MEKDERKTLNNAGISFLLSSTCNGAVMRGQLSNCTQIRLSSNNNTPFKCVRFIKILP